MPIDFNLLRFRLLVFLFSGAYLEEKSLYFGKPPETFLVNFGMHYCSTNTACHSTTVISLAPADTVHS